jgi:voltage-gated potassium channel
MPPNIARPNIIERRMSRFLREPPTVTSAVQVIVVVTMVVVALGGTALRFFDHKEYSSIWDGMWLALQTVSTVGFGDVAPADASGRVVTALLMLYGVAFLTVLIAAITSTFVARSHSEREAVGEDQKESVEAQMAAQLTEVLERLDRIESAQPRAGAS